MINSAVFCITGDVDWASDYCIEDFVSLVTEYGIKPTLFATHKSPVIDKYLSEDRIDVGIHPNFLPGSSHGDDYKTIIDNLLQMFAGAKCFRSHSFFDSTPILAEMAGRGIEYDSNICLHLQPDIVPLNLAMGLTRFPVFWEDDSHWRQTDGDWDLQNYLAHFSSPGLKILNFHPFNVAINTPNQDFYNEAKGHVKTLCADSIDEVRYGGKGLRTFLVELLDCLTQRGERFHTLDEFFHMFAIDDFLVKEEETKGRITAHSDEEYRKYREMSDEEKQRFLRESFDRRDPRDKYATSRDFNLRELEIGAIRANIEQKGSILDLGCGNGYTLISMAEELKDWEMIGIDFSENLIEGAEYLAEESGDKLMSKPKFIRGDAIEYIRNAEADSFRYVISERFILNMPSRDVQKQVIDEVQRILCPGGRFLMCEGSKDGFDALNDLRDATGLDTIPGTSSANISALKINDEEFENYVERRGLRLVGKYGFSDYFVISRVLHPLLIAPTNPRFDARINEQARRIQEVKSLEPGYGANTLWVFEK